MEENIRFGLIGLGGPTGIGRIHLAAIEALANRGLASLVAVTDPAESSLQQEKALLESRGIRWYGDFRRMLEDGDDLDAVVIATPIHLHHEMVLACLHRELFVQLEKPPAPLSSQLEEMIAADTNRRVNVGFQMIGSDCVQALKRLLIDGELGDIQAIRTSACWPRFDDYYARAPWAGRMAMAGKPVFDGPATNALAHVIHNIMYLAAPERDSFALPTDIEGELYRARPIESYDTSCLRGHLDSGVSFSAAFTHATERTEPYRIEVLGSKGWARITEDGALLETSSGFRLHHAETTRQLVKKNYTNFLAVATGRKERFSSRLMDTRGYVHATNAMLESSGGIHTINASAISRYAREGKQGYNVIGLNDAVLNSLTDGLLFSEQNLPWAVANPQLVYSLKGTAPVELIAG